MSVVIGSSRRWTLALVLVLVAVTGCTGRTPDPSRTPAGIPSTAPASPGAGQVQDRAGDGKQIAIKESGFSNSSDDSGRMVSYGIVLANKSRDVAFGTTVRITLLDAQNKPIKDLVADREEVDLVANLVLPRKTKAISNSTYVERPVQSIKISIDRSHWLPDDGRFSDLAVSRVNPIRSDNELEIQFRVHSSYPDTVSPAEAYAIFRDEDGEVIGGTSYNDADQHSYPPGSTDTEIETSTGLPEDWDQVEVSTDPYVGDRI